MAYSGGILSRPIRWKNDVEPVFNIVAMTLSRLCTNYRINPFAKYKPVRWSGSTRTSTWWKADDGDCGFIPYLLPRGYSDVVNHCDGTMNGWEYSKPTGSTYPYRLLDFNGYNHVIGTSVKMFDVLPVRVGVTASDEIVCRLRNPSGTNALKWTDIDTLKNCYFGIYAKKTNSNVAKRATASTTLIGGGGEGSGDMFSVSTYGWSTGTYSVYPFISENYLTIDGSDIAGNFWTIPMTAPVTLTVSSVMTSVIIVSYSIDTTTPLYTLNGYRGYKITANVRIGNAGATAVTFSANTGMTKSGSIDDDMVTGDALWNISSVTVNANSLSNVRMNGVVTTALYDEGVFWMHVRFSNGSLTLTDSVQIDTGNPWQ